MNTKEKTIKVVVKCPQCNWRIDEAVFYTGIGRGTLYKMTDRENCPFVLWIGNKRRIKRRAFDDYIAKSYSV